MGNERDHKAIPEFHAEIGSEGATITYPNLSLSVEDPSRRLEFSIEMMPINIKISRSYAAQDVLVDDESQNLDIVRQARDLSLFPEKQRARLVVDLLKKNFQLATRDNINKLKSTDPETGDWVEQYASENTPFKKVPISEIIEHGYGICTHHSAIYLWLAQEAGLKGAIVRSRPNTIKNIIRSDNQQPLFKSIGEGETVPAHTWVKILLESGEWMPVDPTTGLVGDTLNNLSMFKQANYVCDTYSYREIDYQIEPADKIKLKETCLSIPAGHPSGIFSVGFDLASTQEKKKIRFFNEPSQVIPPTNEPYNGKAVLSVKTDDTGDAKFKIIEVSE